MNAICPTCRQPGTIEQNYVPHRFGTVNYYEPCGHIEFIPDIVQFNQSQASQAQALNYLPGNNPSFPGFLPSNLAQNINPNSLNDANFGLDLGVVMPVKQRMNYRDAVAKLAPIAKQIEDNLFLGRESVQLAGPGVRDAILGGINSHYLVINPVNLRRSIPALYTDLYLRHLKQFQSEKESSIFKIETRFGPVTFELVDVYEAHWDFDRVSYSKGYIHADFLSRDKQATLIEKPKTAAEAQAELQYANEFCQKYGWTISTGSLQLIADVIDADKPFPQEQFVVGFRAYNIVNGYLLGAARHEWSTAQLSVDCPDFHSHIKNVIETQDGYSFFENGKQDSHSCGIYIYKDPVECAQFYGIGKNMYAIAAVVGWGDFWEGERGYRVEHARIEKLWVIKDNVQLRPYEIPGGVIMNAKLGDFYKDIYGTGIDWSNEKSLI